MPPLLSVVIPTFRRPLSLTKAISSALLAAPDGDVEVIVVPNGPDDSWKHVASQWRRDTRIGWHYLPTGHACAARNHGMSMARGKYIRFLDDDDALYAAAAEQLERLENAGLNLSSAPLRNVWGGTRRETIKLLPPETDFLIAALLSIGIGLTQGIVFSRDLVKNLRWSEDVSLYDDYLWMLKIAGVGEQTWLKFDSPVASYLHHRGDRLSYTRRSRASSQRVVSSIVELHQHLSENSRNSLERTHAVATALLSHAHSAFPACPVFLSRTIREACSLDNSAVPLHSPFRQGSLLSRHLVAAEWAMLLPRLFSRGCRRLTWRTRQTLGDSIEAARSTLVE